MNWIINLPWYWILAVVLSACWGVYGCNHEINYGENKEKMKDDKIEKGGIFVSEFIGSLGGWYCFYILIKRISIDYKAFTGIDAFLVIGAVVGMAGYSYRIVELLDKLMLYLVKGVKMKC